MTDLTTRYLGLDLRSPIVASASPLNGDARHRRAASRTPARPPSSCRRCSRRRSSTRRSQLNRALEAGSEHFAEALDYFPDVDDFADAGERYLADLAAHQGRSRRCR